MKFPRLLAFSAAALSSCAYIIPADNNSPRNNLLVGEPHRPQMNNASGPQSANTPNPPPDSAPMMQNTMPPAYHATSMQAQKEMAMNATASPMPDSVPPVPPAPVLVAHGRHIPVENLQFEKANTGDYPSLTNVPPRPPTSGPESTKTKLDAVKTQMEEDRSQAQKAKANLATDAAAEPSLVTPSLKAESVVPPNDSGIHGSAASEKTDLSLPPAALPDAASTSRTVNAPAAEMPAPEKADMAAPLPAAMPEPAAPAGDAAATPSTNAASSEKSWWDRWFDSTPDDTGSVNNAATPTATPPEKEFKWQPVPPPPATEDAPSKNNTETTPANATSSEKSWWDRWFDSTPDDAAPANDMSSGSADAPAPKKADREAPLPAPMPESAASGGTGNTSTDTTPSEKSWWDEWFDSTPDSPAGDMATPADAAPHASAKPMVVKPVAMETPHAKPSVAPAAKASSATLPAIADFAPPAPLAAKPGATAKTATATLSDQSRMSMAPVQPVPVAAVAAGSSSSSIAVESLPPTRALNPSPVAVTASATGPNVRQGDFDPLAAASNTPLPVAYGGTTSVVESTDNVYGSSNYLAPSRYANRY